MSFESFPSVPKAEEGKTSLTTGEMQQIFLDTQASEERRKAAGKPLSPERASLFGQYADKLKNKAAALTAALAVGIGAAGYGMHQYEVQAQNQEQAVATALEQLKSADAKFQSDDEDQGVRYKRHIGAMSNHAYTFDAEALYHLDQAADAAKNLPETSQGEREMKERRMKDVELIRTTVKIEQSLKD